MKIHSVPMTTALSATFLLAGFATKGQAADVCPTQLRCLPVWESDPKPLDANIDDWDDVPAIETTFKNLTGSVYEPGPAKVKCLYNETHILLAVTIPGSLIQNPVEDHHHAALNVMMKIGADATTRMGGCPQAESVEDHCPADMFQACDSYRVHVGAHWKLTSDTPKGQEMRLPGGVYAVSLHCHEEKQQDRYNWFGAWTHTGGNYIYELARPLKTLGNDRDVDLAPGDTFSYGSAFWDPHQSASGWTEPAYYLTSCAENWIEAKLVPEFLSKPEANGEDDGSSFASCWLVWLLSAAFGAALAVV